MLLDLFIFCGLHNKPCTSDTIDLWNTALYQQKTAKKQTGPRAAHGRAAIFHQRAAGLRGNGDFTGIERWWIGLLLPARYR